MIRSVSRSGKHLKAQHPEMEEALERPQSSMNSILCSAPVRANLVHRWRDELAVARAP